MQPITNKWYTRKGQIAKILLVYTLLSVILGGLVKYASEKIKAPEEPVQFKTAPAPMQLPSKRLQDTSGGTDEPDGTQYATAATDRKISRTDTTEFGGLDSSTQYNRSGIALVN